MRTHPKTMWSKKPHHPLNSAALSLSVNIDTSARRRFRNRNCLVWLGSRSDRIRSHACHRDGVEYGRQLGLVCFEIDERSLGIAAPQTTGDQGLMRDNYPYHAFRKSRI